MKLPKIQLKGIRDDTYPNLIREHHQRVVADPSLYENIEPKTETTVADC
jgi:hypothetical protein